MQFKNHNGGWFLEPTVLVSTVSLPRLPGLHRYETCVFAGRKNSEVVETYDSLTDAIAGHVRHSRRYGANIRCN